MHCEGENKMNLIIVLIFLVGLGVAIGKWAESKGYGFWNWFFASSVLGLIWMAFLPNTKDAKYSAEDAEKLVKKGNNTGIVLSVIAVAFLVFQVAMAPGT